MYEMREAIGLERKCMSLDIQKASIWKRIAAWIFDLFLVVTLAVGFVTILLPVSGFEGYRTTYLDACAKYEAQYESGPILISQEEYDAKTPEEKAAYDAAYAALQADPEAAKAYNMLQLQALPLLITSISVLLAVLVWELALPLLLKNGQTLGKKIFGLALIRSDCVKMNNLQLFTRTVLGKYAVELMIPIYLLMLIFFGGGGILCTAGLLILAVAQALCILISRNQCAIHDFLAGTVVVDLASQTVFDSTEDLIAHQQKVAAERAAREPY